MKKFVIVCLLGFLCLPITAHSYNDTVHFFHTAVVVEHLNPSLTDDQKWVVSLCAQLPDETEEYDAVKQYWKFYRDSEWFDEYWDWAWTDNDSEEMGGVLKNSERTRELVTVHQLLHGLTGGKAKGEKGKKGMVETSDAILRRLAKSWKDFNAKESKTITEKMEILCAIGFGVHLLGDTVAHRRLDNKTMMYPTGWGHAEDGAMPDRLLESATKLDGIKEYTNEIPKIFPDKSLKDEDKRLKGLYDKLTVASKMWFVRWRAGPQARKEIISATKDWAQKKDIRPDEHDREKCQPYLNDLIQNLNMQKKDQKERLCAPKCSAVFDYFAKIAKEEFEQLDRKPELSTKDYVHPKIEGHPSACSTTDSPALGS